MTEKKIEPGDPVVTNPRGWRVISASPGWGEVELEREPDPPVHLAWNLPVCIRFACRTCRAAHRLGIPLNKARCASVTLEGA